MAKAAPAKSRLFTIGREHFQKISAVAGIHFNRGMHDEFREFDRQDLPPAERRRALAAKYGGKS